ncbi:hypothetical protein KYG33_05865 [Chryseobacterium sp. D764]|jgi:hypothetical protein|uniref:hypothetical protein n=1 Tax=unclassified Chryseobacterium TaxID=2593645 RepID=UPI000986FEDD|nr:MULTISPECIES: hypothetical protein [unclassified Chryseobacterium]QXU50565.1 hypothetical protein KYG33_05865 [Chryseobacterium sp. D764]CAD0219115.1 conserved protein of unknown function [Chryseobacterium sp. JV274]
MKINNKKKVIHHMIFQLLLIVFLLVTIITLRFLDYHLLPMLFIFITLLALLYGKLKNRFIFEYENSGEILSIKSYQWLSAGKKPRFEMPHRKIVNIEIKEGILKKYLVILFLNSSGKVLRMDIDITFCNENQVNLLFKDITKNMTMKDHEFISEGDDGVLNSK